MQKLTFLNFMMSNSKNLLCDIINIIKYALLPNINM